ncbi:pre-RNA processing PIH1/Nop17-domain-containing protein [Cladochytrium replicatum]|nr:pre-RNA processing PIH1/Nop17-domain-containing protein [Cladochytrium replicatum]
MRNSLGPGSTISAELGLPNISDIHSSPGVDGNETADLDRFLSEISKQLALNPDLAKQVLGGKSDSNPADTSPSEDSVSSLLTAAAAAGINPTDFLDALGKEALTEIVPEPGFVVKTVNRKATPKFDSGLKVFINICHSPRVPAPPLATDEEIRTALEAQDNATYKVPLSLSQPREDKDKVGRKCVVFDACINNAPLEKSRDDFDFQLFLIELALEWVEEKHGMELSREFSIPKLLSKGQLVKHVIRRPARAMISEVKPNPKPNLLPKAASLRKDTPSKKQQGSENAAKQQTAMSTKSREVQKVLPVELNPTISKSQSPAMNGRTNALKGVLLKQAFPPNSGGSFAWALSAVPDEKKPNALILDTLIPDEIGSIAKVDVNLERKSITVWSEGWLPIRVELPVEVNIAVEGNGSPEAIFYSQSRILRITLYPQVPKCL